MKVDLEVKVYLDREDEPREEDRGPIELRITSAEMDNDTIWVYVKEQGK